MIDYRAFRFRLSLCVEPPSRWIQHVNQFYTLHTMLSSIAFTQGAIWGDTERTEAIHYLICSKILRIRRSEQWNSCRWLVFYLQNGIVLARGGCFHKV